MSSLQYVTFKGFTTEHPFVEEDGKVTQSKIGSSVDLEVSLDRDGDNYFMVEATLGGTIDFFSILERFNLVDKFEEEAIARILADKKNARIERGYIENSD